MSHYTFDWIVGICLVLIHAAGLVAAVHAALTARTSQGAIAWAVSLAFMPYLALAPYLIFGRSRFAGYVDAHRTKNRQLRKITSHIDWSKAMSVGIAAADDAVRADIDTLGQLTHAAVTGGNDVRLLINGDQAFSAILSAITAARKYVVVQFFIVNDDNLGRRLKDCLLVKAAQGVPVYFLFDGIGSHALPPEYVNELRAAGIEAHKFVTRRRWLSRFLLNFRNHRKIVVVDGETAYIGGLNVGDEYLGLRPPLSPWRDTHIEVRGPAVTGIQLAFIEDWYWVTQAVPDLFWDPALSDSDMHCQVVASGPADELETCALFFVQAINSARERVWITTPYFVPDEAVFVALKLAVLRGVDVRLLIPSRPDHYIVYQASSFYAHEAVRSGIRMYRYRPGFLHQKVILIDSEAAAVGSANLDNRSFRLNFEITVLTLDRRFAAAVEAMLLHDFAQSRAVRRAEYEKASFPRRGIMRLARLFAPIL
jgi:cardiolipin synthase